MPLSDTSPITVQQRSEGRSELKLEGDLSVFQSAELHRTAMQLLEQGRDVAVDCTDVSSLDCAAVQVLLALREGLAAQGKALEFTVLSPATREALVLSGLLQALGLDNVPGVATANAG
jgi:anti-anti-sigma factor